jgi:hypothetical protein
MSRQSYNGFNHAFCPSRVTLEVLSENETVRFRCAEWFLVEFSDCDCHPRTDFGDLLHHASSGRKVLNSTTRIRRRSRELTLSKMHSDTMPLDGNFEEYDHNILVHTILNSNHQSPRGILKANLSKPFH